MDRVEFLKKIKTTILENHLFSIENDRILVGVSGGVDSISLLKAFTRNSQLLLLCDLNCGQECIYEKRIKKRGNLN